MRPDQTPWTPEQLATLIRLYPIEPPEAVAAAVGRPLKSVYHKASVLGIKSLRKPGHQKGYKPPPKIESRPCLPPSKAAKAAARGPGYLEGEPVRTARTIVTVYAAKPDPHRTQTFSQFGG